MAEFTQRLQILLRPEQIAEIKDIARRERVSVAELIRQSVFNRWQPRSDVQLLRRIQHFRTSANLCLEWHPQDFIESNQ
ncbi:MAG: hypothetical protein KDK39_02815 [Leptospiraceae bacterium]|nr:hypothetical protein [Leptospiraceae bacterium]